MVLFYMNRLFQFQKPHPLLAVDLDSLCLAQFLNLKKMKEALIHMQLTGTLSEVLSDEMGRRAQTAFQGGVPIQETNPIVSFHLFLGQ